MKRHILGLVLLGLLAAPSWSEPPAALRIHLIGVGEYKPVESLSTFKKQLEEQYLVECTTSFGKDGKSLPNLEHETFRRLLTNAIFWTLQRDPEKMKRTK